MIADPAYREKTRAYDRSRAKRAPIKTNDEKELFKYNRKLREEFRDAVSMKFFPDLFNAWKNGATLNDRKTAYRQLADALDFTEDHGEKVQAAKIDKSAFKSFCKDYATKLYKNAQQEVEKAKNSGDAVQISRAQDHFKIATAIYNDIC